MPCYAGNRLGKSSKYPIWVLKGGAPESLARTEGVSKGFCYSNAVFFTFSAFFLVKSRSVFVWEAFFGIKSGTVKAYTISVQSRESYSLSRGVCARTLFRDRLPKIFCFLFVIK